MNPWQRLRRTFRLDKDLDDELRSHLAMDIRERIERGQSQYDAEQDARRELGNELSIKEVTRDIWGGSGIDNARRDFRYAAPDPAQPRLCRSVATLFGVGLGDYRRMFFDR